MHFENICVATDGSDLAVRAAQVAVVLARAAGGRIFAFSVGQPRFSMPVDGAAAFDVEAELRRAEAAAAAHVETVARIAARERVPCATLTRIASAPGAEIVRVAQEQGCDLIVIGAHGPGDANPLFTGSVAQHVMAWSSIPVLLLRDPREASRPEFSDAVPA